MTGKQIKIWLASAGILAVMGTLLTQMGDDAPSIQLKGLSVAQKDSVVKEEVRAAKNGGEIVSLRSETMRVLKVDKSKFQAIISQAPVNYLDEDDGIWKPIDTSVHEINALAKLNPLRAFDSYIDAGDFQATWFNDKPHDYTFRGKHSKVSFVSLNDTSKVKTVTTALKTGIKQSHTVIDTTLRKLRWVIQSNAEPSLKNGEVTFSDSAGFAFRIETPTATDKNLLQVPVTVMISGDTLIYEITLPKGAVYPIVIDPTTSMYTLNVYGCHRATSTTYLTARNSTTGANYGSPQVGQILAGADYYVQRTGYMFNTSALPNNATVTSATLCLGVLSDDSDATGFNVHL